MAARVVASVLLTGVVAPGIGAAPAAADRSTSTCVVDASPAAGLDALGHALSGPVLASAPVGWPTASGDAPTPFDWDGDGSADALVVDTGSGTVEVRWAGGSRMVTTGVRGPTDPGDAPVGATVADVTGDGAPDLLVAHPGGTTVVVGDRGASAGTIAVADVGRADAVDGTRVASGWTLATSRPFDDEVVPGAGPFVVPLWDLTGDGVADFAVGNDHRRGTSALVFAAGRGCLADPDPDTPAPGAPPTVAPAVPVPSGSPSALAVSTPTPLAYLNFPDPELLHDGDDGEWFAYSSGDTGTNTNVQVMHATAPDARWFPIDQFGFTDPAEAFPKQNMGSWTSGSVANTWAPSVHRFDKNPPSSRYLLYYTQLHRDSTPDDERRCIGVARSSSPSGPFVDDSAEPVLCETPPSDETHGGFIDPDVYVEGNLIRLAFAADNDTMGQRNHLYVAELTSDGLRYLGTPFRRLLTKAPSPSWEDSSIDSPTGLAGKIENPSLASGAGRTWLFYSGGDWRTRNYATGFAACTSALPAVACQRDTTNGGGPWLRSERPDGNGVGPGGADLEPISGTQSWMAYHAWDAARVGKPYAREPHFVRVQFGLSGPVTDPVPWAPTVRGTSIQDGSIALWWDPPGYPGSGVASYRIRLLHDGATVVELETDGPVQAATITGLQEWWLYEMRVAARNVGGQLGPYSDVAAGFSVPGGSTYVPVTPFRALDSRTGEGCAHGPMPSGPMGIYLAYHVEVAGCRGLPDRFTLESIVANVTVVTPTTGSYVVAWPGDQPRPETSTVNYPAGTGALASSVTLQVGGDGTIELFPAAGASHVVVDIVGYYPIPSVQSGARHLALAPARVFDTRDGTGRGAACAAGAPGAIGPGQSVRVDLTGCGGLPSDGSVSAVELNVTATNGTRATHVAVTPNGESGVSTVNVASGQTASNLAVVPVADDGSVRVFNNSGSTQVILDLVGYYGPPGGTSGATFHAVAPRRIVDTRDGSGTTTGVVTPASDRLASVGRPPSALPTLGSGLPAAGAFTGIVGSVVADRPSADAHVSVWPAQLALPATSNLNVVAGQPRANMVSTAVSPAGTVLLHLSAGTAHTIIDVQGWFGPESP